MIKVFDTTKEFETYSADGLKSGELCYVTEDKTAHFRTNNIDGVDKDYNMSEGGGSSEPEYNEIQSEFNRYYDGTIVNIPCATGDVLEIIGSDENGPYTPLEVLDANMKSISYDVQEKNMNTNEYTWYVLITENNAAYLTFLNLPGTNFTARYRKLN